MPMGWIASAYCSSASGWTNRERAETPALYIDEIPEQLATRLPPLKAFDRYAMMTNMDPRRLDQFAAAGGGPDAAGLQL